MTQTIGIVGGMSPESTLTYYQTIVRRHFEKFGDHAYPRVLIAGVSFQQYINWQHAGEWDAIAAGLQEEFAAVARAGADFAVLATNTMHKALPDIESPIPVLSIMDAAAIGAQRLGINTVVLTGTGFTMQDKFYADGLRARRLEVVLPKSNEQEDIHHIIYAELIIGKVAPESVKRFQTIARAVLARIESGGAARGACGVLLACTELELLARTPPPDLTFLDTTDLHATLAWEIATEQAEWPDKAPTVAT